MVQIRVSVTVDSLEPCRLAFIRSFGHYCFGCCLWHLGFLLFIGVAVPTVAWSIEIALPWCSASQQICCDTRFGELYRDTCEMESTRSSKIGTHAAKHFRHDTKLGVSLSSGIAWPSGRAKNCGSPRRQSDTSFRSSRKWPFWKRQLRSWFSNSRKRGFEKEGNFDTEAKSCFWKLDFDRGFFVARKTGMGNWQVQGREMLAKGP